MSTPTTDAPQYRFDGLKWAVVVLLMLAIVVGNSYFSEHSLFYRVIVAVVLAAAAAAVAMQTAKGASVWSLFRNARAEVRRVTWPTKQETNQTTLMVVVVVFFMALILWMLDLFFGWLASLLLT